MMPTRTRHLHGWVALCWVGCLGIARLDAQEAPAQADAQPTSEDGIDGTLRHRHRLFHGSSLKNDVVADWLRPLKERGIDAVLTYDALAMGALNDGDEWGAASGDLGLSVRWHIREEDGRWPILLAARLRDRQTIGGGIGGGRDWLFLAGIRVGATF